MKKPKYKILCCFLISVFVICVVAINGCKSWNTFNVPGEQGHLTELSDTPIPFNTQEVPHVPFSGTLTTLSEEWLDMLRIGPDFKYGISQLSPDGQWIMTNRTNNAENINVVDFQPVTDIDSSFQYKEDESLGYITWQSWSPDSTSIVALGADLPGRCPYKRIIIFKLNAAGQELIPQVFTPFPEENKISCVMFAWSPDSSKLAVYFSGNQIGTGSREGSIFILSQEGKLLETLQVSETKQVLFWGFEWTEYGLFYMVKDIPSHKVELYQLDVQTKEENVLNIELPGDWALVGANPSKSPFVLMSDTMGLRYHFVVFNILTEQAFQEFYLDGTVCDIKTASTIPMTAFMCYNPNALWIFDWQENVLINYREVNGLLGWYDNFQGFLVLEKKGNDLQLEVIHP